MADELLGLSWQIVYGRSVVLTEIPINQILAKIRESSVGHTLEEVEANALASGWYVRVMRVDGESCLGTCDYRPDRINVTVVKGNVSEVVSIG